MLSKIKDPAKQVEAWLKAVETAPDGKVTANHIKKTINQLGIETVAGIVRAAREELIKEQKIGKDFRAAYDALFEQVRIERKNKWKNTHRTVILRWLEMLHGAIRNE